MNKTPSGVFSLASFYAEKTLYRGRHKDTMGRLSVLATTEPLRTERQTRRVLNVGAPLSRGNWNKKEAFIFNKITKALSLFVFIGIIWLW